MSAAETKGAQADGTVAMDNTGSHQIPLLGEFGCRFVALQSHFNRLLAGRACTRFQDPLSRKHPSGPVLPP